MAADIVTDKWQSQTGVIEANGQVVAANVDDDPYLELFIAGGLYGTGDGLAGDSVILCLDGNTGEEQWRLTHFFSQLLTPIEMYDVDDDGIVELFFAWSDNSHGHVTGMRCVEGESGVLKWQNWDLRPAWHHFVIIADSVTDVPYIYYNDHSSLLNKVDARTGELVASVAAGLTCNGGVSAADIDDDGDVELILAYHSLPGVQCFDTNLNVVWNGNFDADASTQTPSLIDVNGDDVLDVVVLKQCARNANSAGITVFDGTNGQRLVEYSDANMGLNAHEDGGVWDIDNDGWLEATCAFSGAVSIIELSIPPRIEYTFPYSMSSPPWYQDIVGDDAFEIIVPPYIYQADGNDQYTRVAGTREIWYSYGVLDDIDNDGLLEYFASAPNTGRVVCFDTGKPAVDGLNSCTENYGYRRLGVSTAYEPCPGTSWYSWDEYQADQNPIDDIIKDLPGFELILLLAGAVFFVWSKKHLLK